MNITYAIQPPKDRSQMESSACAIWNNYFDLSQPIANPIFVRLRLPGNIHVVAPLFRNLNSSVYEPQFPNEVFFCNPLLTGVPNDQVA